MFKLHGTSRDKSWRQFRDKRFLGFLFGILISRQENEHRPQKFYKFARVLLRIKKKDPGVFRELFKIGGSIYIKFYKIHFLFYERTHTLFYFLISFHFLPFFFLYPKIYERSNDITILRRCTINLSIRLSKVCSDSASFHLLSRTFVREERKKEKKEKLGGIIRRRQSTLRGSLIADRDDVFTRIRAPLSNSARHGRVPRHASPTPRYERCHADFTPSESSRVAAPSHFPPPLAANAPPRFTRPRKSSRAGVQDVLEFGFGIREQILLRVVLGEACFSGIRASVDLEIIEIFLFYGWED